MKDGRQPRLVRTLLWLLSIALCLGAILWDLGREKVVVRFEGWKSEGWEPPFVYRDRCPLISIHNGSHRSVQLAGIPAPRNARDNPISVYTPKGELDYDREVE